jgi:hypothetical protein
MTTLSLQKRFWSLQKIDLALGRRRINARKSWKIYLEEPKDHLNPFLNILHSRNTRMHRHECNTHNHLFNVQNIGKILKL